MSAFFPDRPTTNNGRARARGKRGRTNREATLNARFVAERAIHRDRPRHSSARIMLYFTLWLRGRRVLTTNLCSLQISLSSLLLSIQRPISPSTSHPATQRESKTEWNPFRPDDE